VLGGADDGNADGADPTWPWELEQPAAVSASATVIVVMTVSDVVRITLYPPPRFTSSAVRPTVIVNRRTRRRES
jgi:hypothetical protein